MRWHSLTPTDQRRRLAIAHRLLRAHVPRRAHAHPGRRHAAVRGRTDREGNAEVGHHGPTVMQEDVLRFDIAVDHTASVRVVDCFGDIRRDADRFVDRQLRLALELVAKNHSTPRRAASSGLRTLSATLRSCLRSCAK